MELEEFIGLYPVRHSPYETIDRDITSIFNALDKAGLAKELTEKQAIVILNAYDLGTMRRQDYSSSRQKLSEKIDYFNVLCKNL